VRSTFITGFPGETDAEFEDLLSFLGEAQLDRVGAFTYSPIEGAAANALPDAVPEELKQERLKRLMTLQAEISAKKLQERRGDIVRVVVDAIDAQQGTLVTRSYAEAPEIDGVILVEAPTQKIMVGDRIDVEIIDAQAHDLIAIIAEEGL
jgi:ribosomal protein S12 methylthiotransferase